MSSKLPQEIVEMIVFHAGKGCDRTCRHMLTVSRSFQAAVERQFYWREINLRSDDMELFTAYCCGLRTSFLHDINFTIVFPKLYNTKENPLKCRETEEDLQDMDEWFSRQIWDLFAGLNIIQERGAKLGNRLSEIHLNIMATRQEYILHEADGEELCPHRRVHNWRLHLLNPNSLPELPSIKFLTFSPREPCNKTLWDNGIRPVDTRVIVDVLSKLPSLESLQCSYLFERFLTAYWYGVYCYISEGPWHDARHDFARAVEDAQLKAAEENLPWASLKTMNLCFWGSTRACQCIDQTQPRPDLVQPKSHDPLSSALRILSQNLTEIDLRVMADSTLFWPPVSDMKADSPIPSWPRLKRLSVEFHPSTPSGTWYFAGRGGEGTDARNYAITEEHYPPLRQSEKDKYLDYLFETEPMLMNSGGRDVFRTEPVTDRIEPLLKSFARALNSMPELEAAELFSSLMWDPDSDREEYYEKNGLFDPGQSSGRWGVKYVTSHEKHRLEWTVGAWRPSESLLRLFHTLKSSQPEKEFEEEWMELEWEPAPWK